MMENKKIPHGTRNTAGTGRAITHINTMLL